MCGICGIVNLDGRPVDRNILEAMNRTLTHRGPDEEGYFINAGKPGSWCRLLEWGYLRGHGFLVSIDKQ